MKTREFFKKAGFTSFLVLSGLLLIFVCSGVRIMAQEGKYRYQATRDLVDLVNDAANMITQQGEVCFRDFSKNGTRWRNGENYLFVCDLKGQIFVHEDTSLVNKSDYDLRDVHGKPIIQWFIRRALGVGQCGWVHYEWKRPGKTKTSWKSSYVRLAKAPSGTIYVVGSGLYDMKMEKEFAVEAVNEAMNLIRIIGKSAFVSLRDSTSEFVYKDTYVFVIDSSYNVLANPGYAFLEQKNQRDLQDSNGKYFVREMVETATEKGDGWVRYKWPKPGNITPENKISYVKKLVYRGQVFIVGTGIYPE